MEAEQARRAEFERLLDEISYEITGARTSGLEEAERSRASLRKARDLLADADALAASTHAGERATGAS
jgi:hypothetical protein